MGGTASVTSSAPGVYNVTFGGTLAKTVPPLITGAGTGGATVAVALLVGGELADPGQHQRCPPSPSPLSGPGFNNAGALESVSGNNGWVGALPSTIPLVNTILLAGNTTIGADSGSTLTVSQTISDLGQGFTLTKVGTGTVAFTGSTANNYGGITTVDDGILQLNKSFGLGASVVSGGNGYKVGDVLTLVGRT